MSANNIGWIGVDLDGTLAEYHGWKSLTEIGEPVPRMLERVKQWLAEGKEVRIFTARVGHTRNISEREEATEAVRSWCITHLGQPLRVTCEKDLGMIELWDDRCVQVKPNTGERVDGQDGPLPFAWNKTA